MPTGKSSSFAISNKAAETEGEGTWGVKLWNLHRSATREEEEKVVTAEGSADVSVPALQGGFLCWF